MEKDSGKKYNWSVESGDYKRDKEATTIKERTKTRKQIENEIIKITKKDVEKNYNWSVESGDYERDKESTTTYQRKRARKKKIKLVFSILLYICGASIVTYLILKSL